MTIEKWLKEMEELHAKVVRVSDDLAAALWEEDTTRDSMLAGSGGVGYSSYISVFCDGESKLKKFNWRHRYNASLDNYALRLHNIEPPAIKEAESATRVELVVENQAGHKWTERFVFGTGKDQPIPTSWWGNSFGAA